MVNTIKYLDFYLHDATIVGYQKLTGSTRRSNSKFYIEMMSDKAANDWIRNKLEGMNHLQRVGLVRLRPLISSQKAYES